MTTLPRSGAGARFALKVALCLGTAAVLLYSAASYAGVEEDYRDALSLYQRGDVVTAIAKLKPGAEGGHPASQALLGDILEGAGITDDAIGWYRKAAAAGNLDGMFMLGSFLATGHGVARDEAQGRELVTRAAQGGHKAAINYVAQASIAGTQGFAKITAAEKSGLVWVRQSAANGHLPSIDFLANAYRTGSLGETDVKQAEALEKQAEQIRFAGRKKPTKKRS